MLQFGCEKKITEEKHDYSHLYKKIHDDSLIFIINAEKATKDSLDKLESKHKTDSISKVANKFISLYMSASKTVYAQISEGICDTNKVKEVMRDCDSSIITLKNESAQKDTTINKIESENIHLREQIKSATDMNDAARQILKGQADNNKALEKEVIKTKRRNKIKNVFVTIGVAVENLLLILALKK